MSCYYIDYSSSWGEYFSVSPARQKTLEEKIKDSDFVICDDKGTHRMVGFKYKKDSMSAPIITFICMRHEMLMAKNLAFSLGKKIYYNSVLSAVAYGYGVGHFIPEKLYPEIATLYAKFFKSEST